MGKGTLTVRAQTASDALPLGNVKIILRDNAGRILYNLVTDENGEVPPVILETVSREMSMIPDYTGTPYAEYDLTAEANGFNSLHISDVQIFDGETAVQPLRLLPLLVGQARPLAHEITIGSHAVADPAARVQEGAMAARTRILPQVIIPDPITVHLGAPSAAAANVRVSFADYVKNVASGEIYPTWPKAALQANIYAIITFALNRVFTQWYRSRGYNFDITSSTAYDQAFKYGRTIYKSISDTADEILNRYVRRAGQLAPYFTSFCNGSTVTCAGLSQWGTVSLANKGKNALQILRTYYPKDLETAQAEITSGAVDAYPGTALRQGSTGRNVELIQSFLARIRKNYPGIPAITDSPGKFGNSTKTAVKKFQSVFNLTADGIVGHATWNKLVNIYVAVAKLASLDSEGSALGIGTVPPASELRQGSGGLDVVILQYLLDFIGEFYPTIQAPAQDGQFGASTARAVSEFQAMMGLPATGIVNPATWNALYTAYWSIRNDVPLPVPGSGPGVPYTVQLGDTLWRLAQRFGTT
ncbi:MAG TPA: hypothetical protein DEQ02_08760, partial [Ruminococcaceae bacterium]|nr:hypothetical protein [Oscillospiraceae bacterium]